MIKTFLTVLSFLLIGSVLVACGERVEVPPATKGKILTPSGYKPDVIPTSSFRFDFCPPWSACDKLVNISIADRPYTETFKLLMPKDQLTMSFDILTTIAIKDDNESIESLLAKVTPNKSENSSRVYSIDAAKVYDTYGRPIVRAKITQIIAKYAINEVASSREAINAELHIALSEAFEGTPLFVKLINIADVTFPPVIVQAKEEAKKREIAIQQEEAEKQVRLIRLEADLAVAQKNRAVEREKALAVKEANAIYAGSVTEEWIKYRRLEVLATMANNPNTVFVPFGALDTVGLSNRMFTKD